MELKNDFRVALPVDQAWRVLTDLSRVAPCMPGAALQGVDDGEYRGTMKVKVGPVTTEYRGVARMLEQDESAGRAVLRAEGRETRGQGTAAATVTAQLTPDGDGTAVAITTNLQITGRAAQFGRGALADVSTRLLGQFAERLEAEISSGAGAAGSGGPEGAA